MYEQFFFNKNLPHILGISHSLESAFLNLLSNIFKVIEDFFLLIILLLLSENNRQLVIFDSMQPGRKCFKSFNRKISQPVARPDFEWTPGDNVLTPGQERVTNNRFNDGALPGTLAPNTDD